MKDEPLIRMRGDDDDGVTIPAVFILLSSGRALAELAFRSSSHGGPVVIVDSNDPFPVSRNGRIVAVVMIPKKVNLSCYCLSPFSLSHPIAAGS